MNTSVGRSEFHLTCKPPGGDLPDAASACAALARSPELIKHPSPFTCAGGTFSWWDLTIRGRIDGAPVDVDFSTCWTVQMATLERLGIGPDSVLRDHLLPRRHEEVLAGTTHVFAAGELDVADLVSCDIHGHHLEAGVPSSAEQPATIGYNGANIVGVTMTVERHQDGSVEADCHTES